MNLQSAIKAVRDSSLDQASGSQRTRGRVLAAVERSPRKRLHAVVAAVIASMFGATAFAWYARTPMPVATKPPAIASAPAVAPVEAPRAVERTVVRVDVDARAAQVEPAAAAPAMIDAHVDSARPVVEARIEESPPAVVDTPAVSSPAASSPAVSSPAASSPAASSPAASSPGVSSDAVVAQRDPELALYAAAHDLHFKRHDMRAALDAWNRYLAASPNGRLAPEARFNRLVALVKLEHWDDAAREIATFTDASFRPRDIERLRAVISRHHR
jgi:hypothetical protein